MKDHMLLRVIVKSCSRTGISYFPSLVGAACSLVVEHPLMVRWVVGLILSDGPTELFLISDSAPQLI